ncbi:MAG: NTP transferase domain-containing protein [Anaerolineales bacterium]|nr:NTP transferase domain-containing protein [Anaerolineales bacterium]
MAGGEGSRLRPLTIGRPKPMVPIVNKAVIGHIFDLLKHHGITEVIVTLRYMASAIQDFYDDGSSIGMKITYSVEEAPLGTAGSVKNAARYLDDTFVVISGDALTDFDLKEIVRVHKARESLASITLTRVPNPLEFGVIVTDEQGRVAQFLEKPSWGEVISDTVNTGLYVLEPEVLDLIPEGVPYDFASELFPRMLADRKPLYGYIADGYWCDVGNITEYMKANADVLYGKLRLPEPIGMHLGGGIWVGENVEIAPSAQLFGPIYLGSEVKIKGDVRIYGPTVIRDYTVVDNYNRIERSLIWRNNYIGESCELRGVIVTRQCSIKAQVVAYEGVVIGDNCVLGEGSVLHPNVKLWPHKEIEAGATIKDSIIWGNQGRRALFSRFGVSGVVNIDLTPEFAAKLSAALGAALPKGSYVAINRDAHRSSRMLKRALISGLPGTGVNVWDLGTVAIPVLRHFVRQRKDTTAGIHVRLSPFDQRVVDIRIIDGQGLNQSNAAERAIERNFFREDFRRAFLNEIGLIDYAHQPIAVYTEDFLRHVDSQRIRDYGFKLVTDYSHGLAADTLADVLTQMGVDVVPLNARMDESKLAMLQGEFKANQERMGKIVQALGANLGVQLDVGGEKIFLVDENGVVIDDITAAALVMELALYAHPGRPVAVPVTMPAAFDTIANWHGARLFRITQNLHGPMHTASYIGVLLIGDGAGSFIFPGFQPAVDGMMATVRLLEYLAIRKLSVSEILAYLPKFSIGKETAECSWEVKGAVMRVMMNRHQHRQMDKIDGVKIYLDHGEWVHLSPNPDKPRFEILAEAGDPERAMELARDYREMIGEIIHELGVMVAPKKDE